MAWRRITVAGVGIGLMMVAVSAWAVHSRPPADTQTSATLGTSSSAAEPPSGGFLAVGETSAVFLQLAWSDAAVSGSWDQVIVSGTKVSPVSYSIIGHLGTGGAVTISLDSATTYSGMWDGSQLSLSIPQADGTISVVRFSTADSNAYNAAVARLQGQASAAAAAEEQQREQASAAAVASASAAEASASAYAALLAATQERTCRAINGHVSSGSCASNVNGDPSGNPGAECDSAYAWFNNDGTIDRGSLETANSFYPGCFAAAASVPSNVAH
jgi:hypothetical protein